jgi:hypothetical protein
VAGVVEVLKHGSKEVWGVEARRHVPSSPVFIVVFERKDRARR